MLFVCNLNFRLKNWPETLKINFRLNKSRLDIGNNITKNKSLFFSRCLGPVVK